MIKNMLWKSGAFACMLAFQIQAADLKDFPEQTHWILTVDVKAAQASPLMNAIVDKIDPAKRQDATNKLAVIKALFGVDVLKDIDHLLIAGNGDASKGGVAYVYGKFDAQRLTTILTGTKHYASADHDGVAVQSWVDEKDNKQKCLTFAKPGLAMLSNTQNALFDALDVLSGKKPGLAESSPLSGAFDRKTQKLLTLHAYGLAAIVGASPKAEALKQAESLSLCIDTPDADSLNATLSVTATTETTAQQIQQALSGIQAIALLRATEAPEPAAIASQAKITCQSRTVGVTLTLPKNLIERSIRAHEERKSAKGAAKATPAPIQTN